MNEIFYEFKEVPSPDLSSNVDIEIILHFLSKVEEYIVLYETKINITKSYFLVKIHAATAAIINNKIVPPNVVLKRYII